MDRHVLKCPQCNAPLAPAKFARSVTCAFCQTVVQVDPTSVSADRYRRALVEWTDPSRHGFKQWWTIGTSAWAPVAHLARGERSEVFAMDRARSLGERAVVKVLQAADDRDAFHREWTVLRHIRQADARGAEVFLRRIPVPILAGEVANGPHAGKAAQVFEWPVGFSHTAQAVHAAFPGGVDPRIGLWVWRRVLELLSFLHDAGFIHGDVRPEHVLLEDGEHGARLLGFSAARPKDPEGVCLDLARTAQTVAYLLGGDFTTGATPNTVPGEMRQLLERSANAPTPLAATPWKLREELGALARRAFGAPSFNPIGMPPLEFHERA